jgi:YidC/Oxa1 family membrane protein insertase
MLVTASNVGASIRRAEMASPRYRDQHDWSGYLGELEAENVANGVRVRVVGAGTPAAKASPRAIEPGDVIVAIGDTESAEALTVDAFKAALGATKPRQTLTLHVQKGDDAPKPLTVRLARRPFAVLRPEIENYEMRRLTTPDIEPPAGFVDQPSFLLTMSSLNGKPLDQANAKRFDELLKNGNWELTGSDKNSATFRRTLPELNLEITKRYSLAIVPPEERDNADFAGYHLQLDIEVRNTGEVPQSLAYQLDGPTGMPLEGWWYAHKISQRWFSAAGLRDVVVRFFDSQELQIDCPEIATGDVEPMGQGQALAYAGVDGQYFSAVMIPLKPLPDVWFDTTEAIVVGPKPDPRTPATFTNVTCRLTRRPIDLAAGAAHRESIQVFIGPKRPSLLAQYQAGGDENYSLKDIVYYGWPLFAAVARAMLFMLHIFYDLVGNYGIAIVMLTVLVRGAMFPISFKQTQNMARMQALKPEMDRITEKYKTDMQKRSQAIQELYRKHKINPLGGCLPLFLQLPIFIGLYKGLMIDVELRQSPLFSEGVRWCSNLAAPDMLYNWSWFMPGFINSGMGFFGLGPYLNILPIFTVAIMLVSQKMAMPPPTTEQAALQQKMMNYMMIFIGLMFYKVASGLCLYLIASSLWGIAERKLLPKAQAPAAAAAGGASDSAPPSGDKRPRDRGPKAGPNGSARSKRERRTKRKK